MYDPQQVTYIAATDARNERKAFGIRAEDRAKHMYVIGKTGMGKSTLLENMAIQDLQNGNGMAFIDPHGSTAEKLLDFVPEDRVNDVVYFAPFDMGNPIAFNVMEDVGYDKRHLVVSGLMSAFNKIWKDAWSARMEYILSNTLLALLEYPDSTLLDVNRMLINKSFRNKVVENITDPIVRAFWVEEFANYTDRYTQDATPAIQNKVGQFTSNPLIRNIVGQPVSTFDIRKIMDEGKILIVNLSKGRMGETNADLLGSMLTTKIYLAAMSRADEPAAVQAKLPQFYFYVDEFQSIANDSFADILSEARKYKLALTIAHQYIEQMEEEVRDAVFGNVGTTIAFRVGPFDAEVLETVFQPRFMAQDIVNLGKAQIYLTLMIDGIGSQPFSAITLPPIVEPEISFRDRIIEHSQTTYGRPRTVVEKEISERSSELEETLKGDHKKASASGPANKPGANHGNENKNVNGGRREERPARNNERREKREERKDERSPQVTLEELKARQRAIAKKNVPQKKEMPLSDLKKQDGKGPSKEQLSELRKALSQAIGKPPQKSEQKPQPAQQKREERPNSRPGEVSTEALEEILRVKNDES